MKRSLLATAAALAMVFGLAGSASAQVVILPTYPLPPVPAFPAYVTPVQVQGITPWGGLNTGNTVIHGSAFAPGRIEGLHSGTAQLINRPVLDGHGNVVGIQQGVAWQNPLTGQMHHQTTTTTPNGLGGVNRTVSVGDH